MQDTLHGGTLQDTLQTSFCFTKGGRAWAAKVS